MEDLVRLFASPPRAPGYRSRSTVGLNEGTPEVTFGGTGDGQTDLGPYARTDEPEDYSWWPRLRMLTAGVQEVVSEWKDVSESVSIDPNVCSEWRLRCHTDELTITVDSLETPSWINKALLWGGVNRAAVVRVTIDWQRAVTNDRRVVTLTDVEFHRGQRPAWSVGAGRDVLFLHFTSDGEKYGFAGGSTFAEPSA